MKKPVYYISVLSVSILSLLIFTACTSDQVIKTGVWRGEFSAAGYAIPFNFEVQPDETGKQTVYLLNGEERAALDPVRHERDSVIIPIELYDAALIAKVDGNTVTGFLRKNQGAKQGIPFQAVHNQNFRFEVAQSHPQKQISGKWAVTLTQERDGKATPREALGVFEQHGADVTGSILTTTGDYRYLAGVLDGNELKLSAFSGSNPVFIQATLTGNDTLTGSFVSPGGKTNLTAVRNESAALPDPYSLTYLRPGVEKFSFTFPDLQTGNPVSLADDQYKGQVVVVTLSGSWCPNCIDEAAFLAPWYKENRNRGVEVIALTFERKDDIGFARERVGKLIKRFDIQYDILFAGLADKDSASEKLQALNAVLSFPTTLFIDKKGSVRKIHTGYTGPATGKYYTDFIKEFNETVTNLLNEEATL